MRKSWKVRQYREGDEHGIFDLIKPEFGISGRHLVQWSWEHKENLCGNSLIGVAERDGKIVGYMAFVLAKMKVGNDIITGSQAVELVVHPKLRRQGIFLALEELLLNTAASRGILFTYAFPTKLVRGGHLKFGFFDVCDVLVLVKCFYLVDMLTEKFPRLFKVKSLLRIIVKPFNPIFRAHFKGKRKPSIEGLRLTEISSFDDRVNGFWDSVSRDYKVIVVRDRNYLNWRYFAEPNQNYTVLVAEKNGQVLGYIVLACKEFDGSKRGYIVDALARSRETDIMQCLLSRAMEHFNKERVSVIACWTLRYGPLYRLLKENGFIDSHSKHPIMARINLPMSSEDLVKDAKHWYVTMGDSDLI